jgi:hypothetical protein
LKDKGDDIMKKLCLIFLFAIGTIVSQPINPNGGFEEATVGEVLGGDIPGWTLYAEGNAFATFEIIDNGAIEGILALSIVIHSLGANTWDIQTVNEPVTVTPNTDYRFSVWARSEIEGPLVNFTVGDPSYTEWARFQGTLTEEWEEYSIEFTTPENASTARVPIHFGEGANSNFFEFPIYLDDLRIEEVTVNVEENDQHPSEFSLNQNYPNPFNPTTTISFNLPIRSDIHLQLLDVLGRVVKEIAAGSYEPGPHQVQLDASNLSSGVYFYKLEAGDFISIKKLVVMK